MQSKLKYKLFPFLTEVFILFVLQEQFLFIKCVEANHCQNYLNNCFSDISKSLQCHITNSPECSVKSAKELCLSLDDAINCTLTIIDWSCGLEQGRYNAWIRGLKGILKKLCYEDISLLKNLLENPRCWNPGTFLSCTELNVGFSHITDLLSTPLDAAECNLVMISIALCNAKAEKNRYVCRGTSKAVIVSLTSFFAESSCMNSITHEMLEEHCSSQANLRAGISVSLTLAILLTLIVIGGFVLTKSRMVTFSRRFRLYNDDDDKETFVH